MERSFSTCSFEGSLRIVLSSLLSFLGESQELWDSRGFVGPGGLDGHWSQSQEAVRGRGSFPEGF